MMTFFQCLFGSTSFNFSNGHVFLCLNVRKLLDGNQNWIFRWLNNPYVHRKLAECSCILYRKFHLELRWNLSKNMSCNICVCLKINKKTGNIWGLTYLIFCFIFMKFFSLLSCNLKISIFHCNDLKEHLLLYWISNFHWHIVFLKIGRSSREKALLQLPICQ